MKEESRTKEAGNRFTRKGIKKLPLVVVVNDDPVQLSIISILTGKEAVEVQSFSSASDALQFMLKSGPPQLIITDLHMPGIDGWRFCRMIRSPEFSPLNHVPVLVVSATCAGMDVHSITAGLGANGFLSAPCEPVDFRAKVRNLLKGKPLDSAPVFLLLHADILFFRSLKSTIHSRGCEVYHAKRHVDLWRLFFKHRPLGILIDGALAAANHGTLIAEIKRHSSLCAVIIVSEQTSGEEAIRWVEAGADAYVGRQAPVEEILDVCESASRERALLGIKDRLHLHCDALKTSESRYRAAFEAAGDAMLIFEDTTGMIVDANEAATRLYDCTRGELQAVRFGELAATQNESCRASGKDGNSTYVWHRRKSGSGFPAEIVVRAYVSEGDRLSVALVRDLSDRMQADKEKEQAIAQLEGSLAKMRTLRGLLHICANCKKIKDEKGFWTPLEPFLSRRSEARFSHSICPDCARKLYPEHT